LLGLPLPPSKKINPMKNLLLVFSVLITLSSCSSIKNSFRAKPAANTSYTREPKKSQFIEGIEIKPGDVSITAQSQSQLSEDDEIKPENSPVTTKLETSNKSFAFQTKTTATAVSALEYFSIAQFKYAIQLDVPVETLRNKTLYETISDWWGTPYRMGGTTRRGIDCSAFVQTLMMGVFAVQLPRTARDQKTVTSWIPIKDLKEGDLVFFNTRGGISHVGVYLQNNKFVHASSSKGVMISDLNDTYWSKKIIGGGRVLRSIDPVP
jgi:cell wall-associated NlpC family hydrolase